MENRWNDAELSHFAADDLGPLVYASRLLGRDFDLTQFGGGNTSVKRHEADLFGEVTARLYVKGSGYDLSTISEAGFTPLRLAEIARLVTLPAMSDTQMMDAMMGARTRADAPPPSVETILHAVLPYKYVLHAHAVPVMSLTGAANGEQDARQVYGDSVVYVPYVMPGFKLARLGYACWQQAVRPRPPAGELLSSDTDGKIGMVWLKHGIVSWGDSAREAYDRLIELTCRAADWIAARRPMPVLPAASPAVGPQRGALAGFRHTLSAAAGAPLIVRRSTSPQAAAFAAHEQVASWSHRGPMTPDHLTRTKSYPLIGRDVQGYVVAYRAYFERHKGRSDAPLTMLDPAPRVILDGEWGMLTAGRTAKDAALAGAVYERTIEAIVRAESAGGWESISEADQFDVEYWELEQARLRRSGALKPFSGEVALVTGAASGIGRACAAALHAQGAAVVALDINPEVARIFTAEDEIGFVCDLTDERELGEALEAAVSRFGGLDMLVVNAGIFPPSLPLAQMTLSSWRRTMSINLDANVVLLREAHPLLKLSPRGGRVVIIGSKNVPAPGPGAAAYSASKAALNQMARVAALEWGADNIRVNTVHPNQVFDTGLWTEEIIAARAKHYGLSVQDYKTSNVLKAEVSSKDVAAAVAALMSDTFRVTTGAQIPVDGGNDRVI
jgi:rhamnose utilization protein RhaD (predicted bifunctional aldolase and dehydrogenase)/NAD(P)-dependent dehydrogenase (short-subunit alcohol dehydrogenase family)